MKHLVLAVTLLLAIGSALAQEDPCAGSTGAAYGLCSAYCVHLKCGTDTRPASQAACAKIAAAYVQLAGSPLVCGSAATGLVCACSGGILNCSASGLEGGVMAFLNIDLRAYFYGQNGVGDALTDANGNVQFPPFDLYGYLAVRDLTLSSVVMQVTNQPGNTLLQATVPVCPR